MLYDGAVLLFSHDETASGTDLAKLYVDTLNQAEQAPEELHFVRISKYAVAIERGFINILYNFSVITD